MSRRLSKTECGTLFRTRHIIRMERMNLSPIKPRIVLELPTLTATCRCGKEFKSATTLAGREVMIRFPYMIEEIFCNAGHSYEVISTYFLHQCPKSHALDLAA